MKKTIVMLLAALMLLMLAACGDGRAATPSPMMTARPSPTVAATIAPAASPSAPVSPEMSAGGADGAGGAGGTIDGFTEGDTVDVSALPEAVTKAVEEKYPGVTVTAATYATYLDAQMYLLTLSGGTDTPERVYVGADGKIEEYMTSPSPAAR